MSKILFWSGFGLAVRFWQLGIEMRPFFTTKTAWIYGVYGTVGAGVGYWLTGVEQRQMKILTERRNVLLDKRRRRAERNGEVFDEKLYERPVIGPSATVATAV